jgi:carbon monoxide dehydrogenase subunit G
MKLLLKIVVAALLILVVLPVLVLCAMHFRPGAGQLVTSVEIARPRAQVWRWLSEEDKLKQWVGWLAAIESDSTSPAGVGHREVWVMDDPHMDKKNGPMRLPTTMTGWDPPNSMAGHVGVAGVFDGEFTYKVDDLGDRTRVTSVSDWRYHGISWLLEPLVTPEANKKMTTDFGTLKAKVEAEPVATN